MGRRTDLWIVGTGVRGLDQLTPETLRVLERARVVLHLTHQHRKLQKINPNLIDLEKFYWTGEEEWQVYDRLIQMVLDEIAKGPEVVLASYGHPMVFDDTTMELLEMSKKGKFTCRVLPAVSCLDTMCIDVGIDPGDGLQILEASDIVEHEIPVNPQLNTLLFQLGTFGSAVIGEDENAPGRFTPLVEYLERFYPADHRVVIVFSDDGSMSEADLLKTKLSRLDSHRRRIFPGVTLFIPALATV